MTSAKKLIRIGTYVAIVGVFSAIFTIFFGRTNAGYSNVPPTLPGVESVSADGLPGGGGGGGDGADGGGGGGTGDCGSGGDCV
jgi:hypothetical protein